jgi:AGCS family alanine or glycine:cation symporter
MEGGIVWKLADILNGMMAFPNLIALLFLSPVVFALTKEYFAEGEGRTIAAKET